MTAPRRRVAEERRAALRAAAGRLTYAEVFIRLLRAARGGIVTVRLIEAALRGAGARPYLGLAADAATFARRSKLRSGESIEIVWGGGAYYLAGPNLS